MKLLHSCILTLALFGSARVLADDKEIIIGDVMPYSGGASVFAIPYKVAVDMAAEEINAAGGINGRKVRVIHRDDSLNPAESKKKAEELVLREKVDVLMGGMNGATCDAISSVAKRHKKMYFIGLCTLESLTTGKGTDFVANPGDINTPWVFSLADRAMREWPEANNWAIIAESGHFGRDQAKLFTERMKKLNPKFKVVRETFVEFGTQDFNSHITALLNTKADAVWSSVWGADSITFVKQAKGHDFFNKTKYIGSSLGMTEELFAVGADAPKGAIVYGFPDYDKNVQGKYPQLAAWVKKFKEKSGNPNAMPGYGPWIGYQVTKIMAEIIKKAGSTEVPALQTVMKQDASYEMPWGKVVMRGCDRQAYRNVFTGIIDLNGSQGFISQVEDKPGVDFTKDCNSLAMNK